MIKKLALNGFYGEDLKLIAVKTSYANNGRLAVILFDENGEIFCDLSKNLDFETSDATNNNLVFVDTNNSPFLIEFIEENNLGKATGYYGLSGFCSYPEYEINIELLTDAKELEAL